MIFQFAFGKTFLGPAKVMLALRECAGKLRRAPGVAPSGGIPLFLASDVNAARQRLIQMPFSPNTSFLETVPLLREVKSGNSHANASLYMAEHFVKLRERRQVVRFFCNVLTC